MKADLHMHSTHSDGFFECEDLFQMASKRGLDYISITDHDTCYEVDRNFALSKKYGVNYIPGIELTTVVKEKNVHVLGYFTDESYKSEEMLQYYKDIKTKREVRAKQFIKNLKTYFDLEVDYQDAYDYGRGIIARPHIAKAIIKKYPEYTHDDIFDQFIGDNSKAYVPSSLLSLQEGIDLLRRNNCVIVLAHPVLLKKKVKEEVLSHDFDGLEAIYFLNKEEDTMFYKNLAKDKGILITAGSDFHGIKNDTRHGNVGDCTLEGKDLENFLKKCL